MTSRDYPASAKQIAFIKRLNDERTIPEGGTDDESAFLWERNFDAANDPSKFVSSSEASKVIGWLLNLPRQEAATDEDAIEGKVLRPGSLVLAQGNREAMEKAQGVYQLDGQVYVVKMNKARTNIYCKHLIDSPDRMTEAGTTIPFEMEYAPGIVAKLAESDRMLLADARAIMTRYGRCLYCARSLKAAKSVARMVGPVCAKRFRVTMADQQAATADIQQPARADVVQPGPRGADRSAVRRVTARSSRAATLDELTRRFGS